MKKTTIFWFRRDLRLEDNAGLFFALKEKQENVLPLFIFDSDILGKLDDPADPRVTFIYDSIRELKSTLQSLKGDLLVRKGSPIEVFKSLRQQWDIGAIYLNHDYEPAARSRDEIIARWAAENNIELKTFKDQTLFEKNEILTDAGKPYSVYTPYKNKVLANLRDHSLQAFAFESVAGSLAKIPKPEVIFSLEEVGFQRTKLILPEKKMSLDIIKNYEKTRDIPALKKGTSLLGVHLRFGTISVRQLARAAKGVSDVYLSELIWRDFFMQILWHYPFVVERSFRPEYDKIAWRNSQSDFQRWTEGMTGYPLVDAGMRELNATGHMHNRVRMVVGSFLCKHLLIHWSQGERYFAKKLLDFDLAANNGNWQWVAGSGCDAAPYFRIFNPEAQAKKFDPKGEYVKKWVPEYDTLRYSQPMVDHNEARGRCLQAYSVVQKK